MNQNPSLKISLLKVKSVMVLQLWEVCAHKSPLHTIPKSKTSRKCIKILSMSQL